MKSLKNISDELWLGLMFILFSVWLFAIKLDYLLVSGAFMLVGIFLIIIDVVRKNETVKNNAIKQDKKSTNTKKKIKLT